jgi:hypothetical protein
MLTQADTDHHQPSATRSLHTGHNRCYTKPSLHKRAFFIFFSSINSILNIDLAFLCP